MELRSDTFTNGGTIPDSAIFNGMGLAGGNTSPHLAWSDVPAGAKSFAVVCHDPDAPTSGGFYHWVMFNIPGDARELAEGAGNKKLSAFVHGEVLGHIDYGVEQYGGPCPPPGPAHHYHFTVYALDADTLPLSSSATGALVEFQAADHTLAKATITGLFARPA
jgi:Raf kinase inhibitor-like YbhB/YbcL family protein